MKTIILPSDFSKNALKAFEFALDFFNEQGNHFILLHTYDIPHGGTSALFTLLEQMRIQAEKDMAEFIALINSKYNLEQIKITQKILNGSMEENCIGLANEYEADYSIVGTKGASGIKEVLIGSHASRLLKSSSVPVIAVPADYEYAKIKELDFSYDGKKLNDNTVKKIIEFLTIKKLPLKILHIRSEKEPPIQNMNELKGLFSPTPISLHEIYSNNYEEGIKKMLHQFEGILVLINRKKTFWETFIGDSDTQRVIKHIPLPILIIPE